MAGGGGASQTEVEGLGKCFAHHDTPVGGLGELGSLDRLGDGSDWIEKVSNVRACATWTVKRLTLVDLEEETVAGLLLNGRLDADDVGDGKVVSDDLGLGVLGKVSPRLPVVLVEGVLDRDDRVLGNHLVVLSGELLSRDPLGRVRLGVLEVEVVLALLVELGRGNIEGDRDLAGVAGLLDGLNEELERLGGARNVGGESSLVTDVGGYEKWACQWNEARLRNLRRNVSPPSIPYLVWMTFLRWW